MEPRAAQAHEWVRAGAVLLDVRTPKEFEAGHLPGAKNIPVQELAQALDTVGPPRARVVVYCHLGHRSAAAASLLTRAGFDVCDLGPMSAW